MSRRARTAAACCRGTLVLAMIAAAAGSALAQGVQGKPITLAWDANTSPDVTGYVVYVGTEAGVLSTTYDVGDRTTFTFRGTVQGTRYHFAVAAYTDVHVGAPSAELSVVAAAPLTTASSSNPQTGCGLTVSAGCALQPVDAPRPAYGASALAVRPDGRFLLVDRGRHVRLLAPGVSAAPAVLTARDGTELTRLVLDPDFAATGYVFVGVAHTRADGARELNIVRYREVQSVLGEGTVVVAGLPLSGADTAPFTVDANGRIYVAMPVHGSGSRQAYDGHVLWFDANGSVPREARGGSPILGQAVPTPLALAVAGRDLWMVGGDAQWTRSIAGLTPGLVHGREWPVRPVAVAVERPASTNASTVINGFDVAPARDDRGLAEAVLLDASGQVHRLRQTGDQTVERIESFAWPDGETPVAVAFGSHTIYVAIQRADGSLAVEDLSQAIRTRVVRP